MTLTTIPADDRLDLAPHVGQRSATFRFRLVDAVTGAPLGDLTPLRDSRPTLVHDTTRTIKRSTDLRFERADTAAINTLTDRITIAMLIGGVEHPLGRYMFIDQVRRRFTAGIRSDAAIVDEMFIIDQQLDRAFTARTDVIILNNIKVRDSADRTLREFLNRYPVTYDIAEPTPFPGVGSWSAGIYGGQVVDALAMQGDYFSPWFGNDGKMHFIRSFDPADHVVDLDFDTGNRVIRGSVAESDDLLQAPNRFVVVSNSNIFEDPAVGTYDIPATAPHSIQNRGFVISDVQSLQLGTPDQAAAVARNIGLRHTVFERVALDTAPDPRHDSYQVIRWRGFNWLELSWSLQLSEGGNMRHILRKAYTGA